MPFTGAQVALIMECNEQNNRSLVDFALSDPSRLSTGFPVDYALGMDTRKLGISVAAIMNITRTSVDTISHNFAVLSSSGSLVGYPRIVSLSGPNYH